MKKFKIGADITKKEEVKDLIKNIVAGSDEFTASWLNKVTNSYLIGSPLKLPEQQVEKIVELTLYDLQMENKICCEDGVFIKVKNKNLGV